MEQEFKTKTELISICSDVLGWRLSRQNSERVRLQCKTNSARVSVRYCFQTALVQHRSLWSERALSLTQNFSCYNAPSASLSWWRGDSSCCWQNSHRGSPKSRPLSVAGSVAVASRDILSHRQAHSCSLSSCARAWDPPTGAGHFKAAQTHSCSLSALLPRSSL